MAEMVKHPNHYQSETGLECWDVMAQIFGKAAVIIFCKLNVFKYIWRLGKKNSAKEDMRKAAEYYRKEEHLRTGVDRRRSDIHCLQQIKRRLLDMADDLEREIVDLMIEEEREKRGIQRRV